MDDIAKELAEIGRLLNSAHLIDDVRTEVRRALKGRRAMVVGGEYTNNPEFDVVITHHEGEEGSDLIARRLGSIEDIKVEQIDSITDDILGIKYARRGQHNDSTKA